MDEDELTQETHAESAMTGIYIDLEDNIQTSIQIGFKMAENVSLIQTAFPDKVPKDLFNELNESLKHLKNASNLLKDVFVELNKEN